MASLKVENLCRFFGGVKAVNNVSFEVNEGGQIVSLIGPNGAGKTTAFQCISGYLPIQSGTVTFADKVVNKMPIHRRVELGMGRTFQKSQVFPLLSVLENVLCGQHLDMKAGMIAAGLQMPYVQKEEERFTEKAEEILDFVNLLSKKDKIVSELSYGEKRMLEIGRALNTQTRILMLDEPAAGLNGAEKEMLFSKIKEIASRGISVLLVEHDMGLVMNISDHVVVLNFGEVIASGLPADVKNNQKVVESYLGKGFTRRYARKNKGTKRTGDNK